MRLRSGADIGGAFAAALFVVLSACEAVPSLNFEGDDGGGSDAAGAQCPTKVPQGAATCCGAVPCYGMYCTTPANCATCMNCGAGESCCAKNANMPMCFGASMSCH